MRSKSLLLGALVGIGLLAAYWVLLLAPKREEVALLKTKVTEKQQEVTAAEGTLVTYRQARDNYKQTYARVTQLGKAVPGDDDVRSLVVQLDSAAKASKVNFRSIAAAGGSGPSTAPASGAATGLTPPPGAISSGAGAFSTMPFTLAFTGNYDRLSDVFTQLERFVSVKPDAISVTGRLMRIDSIVLTPEAGELPSNLLATVKASTFLIPPTQAVAGAAPQAAAGATTTASAPSGGSTVPTPTAAATGAIE